MEYNLLLNQYDKYCDMLIDGNISLELFQLIENEYTKRHKLFIINLN